MTNKKKPARSLRASSSRDDSNPADASRADSIREPICELPLNNDSQHDSHNKSQAMSNRQLEQLRETLDSIVEELCTREEAVDKEQAQLAQRLNDLDQRQSHLKSLEEVLELHHATESELAERLQSLVSSLDKRALETPAWLTTAIDQLESRIVERVTTELEQLPKAPPAPSLREIASEMERTQARSVNTLTEQLTASLQAAISVQLAPLSDDLPDRLQAVVASAVPAAPTSLPLAMPELARELEKFETRSMASMAARMTAGLQTALANQFAALSEELTSKLNTLHVQASHSHTITDDERSDESQTIQRQADRIETLTSQLAASQKSLQETEGLLAEALEHVDPDASSCKAGTEVQFEAPPHLIVRMTQLEEECERLTQQLKDRESATGDSSNGSSLAVDLSSSEDELIEALRTEITELRNLLQVKEKDSVLLDELRAEVAELRAHSFGDSNALTLTADTELRERLERATCEIIDLRSENEELNQQVSRLQISTAPHGHMPHLGHEGLSWEERKKLLLLQLNAELNDDDQPQNHAKRLEIEDVIKTTDAELQRRDREIAELRSLLEQQSSARGDVAVGAAAVAQLIESDELVQEEREKLRGMQKSWDEKFRQAEIDLSMERAKLARERLQLEEQKQKLEEALHAAQQAGQAGDASRAGADPKARKWLSRLGLKDEQ